MLKLSRRAEKADGALRRNANLRASADAYLDGGVEPPLEELLSDPIMAALLRSDRVESGELSALLNKARSGLINKPAYA